MKVFMGRYALIALVALLPLALLPAANNSAFYKVRLPLMRRTC